MINDGQCMSDGFYYHVGSEYLAPGTRLIVDKSGRELGGKLFSGAYLNAEPEPHHTIMVDCSASTYVYKVYARKVYYEARYADYISAHATVVACLGTVGELFPIYFGKLGRLYQEVRSIIGRADVLQNTGDLSMIHGLIWSIDRLTKTEYETGVMRYELPDNIILKLIEAEELVNRLAE